MTFEYQYISQRWRWIPGYESRYVVSDHGEVWSYVNGNGRGVKTDSLPMSPAKNHAGYHVISLYDGSGKRRQHRVHCLVLEAFVGPRPEGMQAAHKDDNKDDNYLGNLEWKTVGGNVRDKQRNGRIASGERHGRYKDGEYVGRTRRYAPPKHI